MKRTVLLENYSENEGDCECECGLKVTDSTMVIFQAFILRLERAYGCQIRHVITSGGRCSEHNKEIGGAASSRHIKGDAVDGIFQQLKNSNWVQISNAEIATHAKRSGLFGGIGYKSYVAQGKNLIHLDTRPGSLATW